MRLFDSTSSRVRRHAVLLTSLVIVGVLGLQASISLVVSPFARQFRKTWPFLDYPMYSRVHRAGETISLQKIVGILEDRTEIILESQKLGLGEWDLHIFLRGIRAKDRGVISEFVRLCEDRLSIRLTGLRVENHGMILASEGLVEAPRNVLTTVDLKEAGEQP